MSTSDQKDRMIDRKSAAKILGLTPRTVDRYVRSNRLSASKIGNKVFLLENEVNKIKYVRDRLNADLAAEQRESMRNEGEEVDREVDRGVYVDREVDKSVHIKKGLNEAENSQVVDKKVTQMSGIDVDRGVYVDREVDKSVHIEKGVNEAENSLRVDTSVYSQEAEVDNGVYFNNSSKSLTSQNSVFSYAESIYKALYEEAKDELKEKQKKLEGANYKVGQLESQVKNSVPQFEYKREQQKLLIQSKKFDEEKRELIEIMENKNEELKIERTNRIVFAVILFTFLLLQPIFWLLWRFYQG
ncbi:helix-turn-helix domain-containing protein [Patescibacteria group bacterium]|nr:helix-turn-helix domain-containing protein [Patescibacteria group bacterium]